MTYNFSYNGNDLARMFRENLSGEGGVAAAVVLSIFLTLMTLWLVLWAVYYVFKRIGLYKMAKNAGIPNAWLTFLPFANTYYMGLLAERSLYVSSNKRQPIGMVYLIVTLGLWVVSGISLFGLWPLAVIGALGGLFAKVLKFYCLYYIYHDYSPDNDVLYTVLEIVPLATPILFMVYRNAVPVSVAGRQEGGQPKYAARRPAPPSGGDQTQSY